MAFLERLIATLFNGGYVEVDAVQLSSIAQFAGMISSDSAAFEAAKQATIDCREDVPPWLDQVIHQNNRIIWPRVKEQARRHFEASISRHAASGACEYVRGRGGNAYTRFLVSRFGPVADIRPSLGFAGPTQAGASGMPPEFDPNQVISWPGSGNFDRFGMKQFSTIIPNDSDARTLLGKVSTVLTKIVTPVSRGRPWKTFEGVTRSNLHPTAKLFHADADYVTDNRPFITRQGKRLILQSDVSGGRGKQGGGTVHLECTAVTPETRKEAVLIFAFGQGTAPMWLSRQSEALIACTLLKLADLLGAAANSMVNWEFKRGDWVHSQLLLIPGHGSVELVRARG